MNTKRLLVSVVLSLGLLLILSLLTFTRTSMPVLARPLSDSHVGGTIGTDTTWTMAGSPFMLDGDVTVAPGVTLTIEPGVTVMGNGGVSLIVAGNLKAIGVATQPITFTSVTNTGKDQWGGLVFDGASAAGNLQYVTVRYAGGGGGLHDTYPGFADILAYNVVTGEVHVENSQVLTGGNNWYQTNYGGIYVNNSQVSVSNTLFSDNGYSVTDWPLVVDGPASVLTLTQSTFTGNTNDRVRLKPGAMTGHDFTLSPQAALQGYELTDSFVVPTGITLTVEPGVTVLSHGGVELTVQGRLQAVGIPTQPITFTSLADTGRDQWTGLAFDGGAGLLRYVTLRYAGNYIHGGDPLDGFEPWQVPCGVALTARNVLTGELHIEHTQFVMNGLEYWWRADAVMRFYNSHVTIQDSYISDNGSPSTKYGALPEPNYVIFAYGPSTDLMLTHNTFDQNRGWLFFDGGQFTLDGNLIRHQTRGVLVRPNQGLLLLNNVLADLGGDALQVIANGQATALHTTLARNSGNAVYVKAGGAAAMTNTILSGNTTGVRVDSGGSMTLARTLWDKNTANTGGVVSATGNITGSAAFADDGYHLTRYSFALDQGVDAGVPNDIDEQPRPMPVSAPPDLGADEYPSSPGQEFVAENVALPPQMLPPDSSRGNPYWRLRQTYLIRYAYGSPDPNPPDLALAITDALPTELALESQATYPSLGFQQHGNTLEWNSPALHVRQSGTIQLVGVYTTPRAGRVLTNQAVLQAGAFHFDLQATSSVPLVAPLITSPGSGEICSGTIEIHGSAQSGVTVTVYVNGTSYTSLQPDASGLFTATYSYAGTSSAAIKAKACLNDSQCSADSNVITLTAPQSFWCPQRSYWEGTPTVGPLAGKHLTYRFRDNTGKFSTQNWIIPGVYGFWNTTLHLRACNCPNGSQPGNIWVVADGVRYDPSGAYPDYTFAIGAAHTVVFWAQCGSSQGQVLIDPDGYVFDVTKGFVVPTNTVQGVTVTAYVSMPQWGGWVPWPAQLYNNQVNPQVTGADGYFAFFTPPGQYYLQAEGTNGYQSWRSPVINVITQVVHMNVPLTPWAGQVGQVVNLSNTGPSPAIITVPVGSSVQWVSELNSLTSPAELAELIKNPVLRLLSARNPLSDTLGFDGGMMTPGQVYRRQFTRPGTYTYSDGVGHTAQVVVTNYRTYLPLVMKSH